MSFSKSSYPNSQPTSSSSWSVIWFNALRRPFLATFEEFACDPNASLQRSFLWVILSTLLTGILFALNPYHQTKLLSLVVKTPISILIYSLVAVFIFVLMIGLTQLVARVIDGEGTFTNLAYTIACFHAPLLIIRGLFIASPVIVGILILYGTYLEVVATKAAQKFSWGKAVITTIFVYLIFLFLVSVAAIVYFYIIKSNQIVPSLRSL